MCNKYREQCNKVERERGGEGERGERERYYEKESCKEKKQEKKECIRYKGRHWYFLLIQFNMETIFLEAFMECLEGRDERDEEIKKEWYWLENDTVDCLERQVRKESRSEV